MLTQHLPTKSSCRFALLLPVGQWVYDKSRVLLNLQQQSPPDSFVSIRVLRVLPLSAFKSNHSPLFWRGAGGEALSLFWRGVGGEASVLPLFIALRKDAGTAHNKKDGDAIVQLAYVIASPSFLFKLET